MFSLTIARIPSAASSTEARPMASAIVCTAARAASTSSCHLAAQQARRQVAEHDVRVGHGRLRAAAPVGRRARVGARGLRADAERLRQLRHVGDRAAAGADGVDVDGRHLDAEVADRRLAPDRRLAVLAQRDVGRRAAHVEGQDVVEPRLAGDVERAGDAAGRAGQDPVDRVPAPPRAVVIRPASERRMLTSAVAPIPPSSRCRSLDVGRDLRVGRTSSCTPSASARTRGTPAARARRA